MFNSYIDFIKTNKRCPSKYKPEERNLVNWAKYNRKMRNKGLLSPDFSVASPKISYMSNKGLICPCSSVRNKVLLMILPLGSFT